MTGILPLQGAVLGEGGATQCIGRKIVRILKGFPAALRSQSSLWSPSPGCTSSPGHRSEPGPSTQWHLVISLGTLVGPGEEGGRNPQESATSPSSGRMGKLQRCSLGPRILHPGNTRSPPELGHCTVAQPLSTSATMRDYCCHIIKKIKAKTRTKFEPTQLEC